MSSRRRESKSAIAAAMPERGGAFARGSFRGYRARAHRFAARAAAGRTQRTEGVVSKSQEKATDFETFRSPNETREAPGRRRSGSPLRLSSKSRLRSLQFRLDPRLERRILRPIAEPFASQRERSISWSRRTSGVQVAVSNGIWAPSLARHHSKESCLASRGRLWHPGCNSFRWPTN
jgi:hypothetical protein